MQAFDHAHRTTRGARDYQEDTAVLWSGTVADISDPAGLAGRVRSVEVASAPHQAQEGDVDDDVVHLHARQAADRNGPSQDNAALLAVLADGMGGHAGGAVASKTVCNTFIESFVHGSGPPRERLIASLRQANQAVKGMSEDDPMLSGMGSTLVSAIFGAQGVEWVSVGDSPLMLFRGGEIALLNEDHSLAPELDRLAATGSISEEQARRDPRRHMLRSAITGEDIELVDLSRAPLKMEAGDYIILASDGVHTLEPREIERIVEAYGKDGASAVCDAIIRAVEAVRDPHQDNATVLAVRLLDGLEPPAAA